MRLATLLTYSKLSESLLLLGLDLSNKTYYGTKVDVSHTEKGWDINFGNSRVSLEVAKKFIVFNKENESIRLVLNDSSLAEQPDNIKLRYDILSGWLFGTDKTELKNYTTHPSSIIAYHKVYKKEGKGAAAACVTPCLSKTKFMASLPKRWKVLSSHLKNFGWSTVLDISSGN